MLSIRMQRLGRKGYPVYRVVVQDSRQSPSSGKYIALLGSYNPHTKTASLEKDKAQHFLKNGAQPSERVVKLFAEEKISLPKWVEKPQKQKKEIRNPDKLRKNRPADAQEKSETVTENEESPEAESPAEPEAEAIETAEAETTKDENSAGAEEKPAEEAKAEPESSEPAEAEKSSETEVSTETDTAEEKKT